MKDWPAGAVSCLCAVRRDPVEEGRYLHQSNCAFCHGITGTGGRGPALNHGNLMHGSTVDDIQRMFRGEVPGTNMPTSGGNSARF
jgi:mono/diheme cytochrome c family protein